MTGENRHAIGVCTFRRPGLADTLATLAKQSAPPGGLTILVADNDEDPTAQELVADFAQQSPHTVIYLHAPARNISVARNAILAAARGRDLRFLAFIDDDELAPPDWYRNLLRAVSESRADAAVGPVRAVYPPNSPGWMARTQSHDTRPETDRHGRPIAGHSCNVIIDLKAAAFDGLLFSPARGRTGGEDTAFFRAAQQRGAVLALVPDAEVTEAVLPDRARLGWLLQRRYRMGQTHGSLLAAQDGQGRFRRAAVSAAKLTWCAGAALLALPVATGRNTALVRGALHAGVLADAIGLARVEPYGAPTGAIETERGGS